MQIIPNYDLRQRHTFALPATCSYYIEVESIEDVEKLGRDEFFRSIPFFFIGEGSNLLFKGDFKGAILHVKSDEVTILSEDETEVVWLVQAGKKWHDVVLESVAQGLWGIENLALIPGEVGSAAVQNIGAYGREVADAIVAVHVADLRTGQVERLEMTACHYGYRHSIFKEEGMEHALVYAVELRLSKQLVPNLTYQGLQDLTEDPHLTPQKVAERVMTIRQGKLPDPLDLPNAGSFFTNPFVTKEKFAELLISYPTIPSFPTGEGYKIPAAWLIEQAGWKGKRIGDVGTHVNQPLVIVNHGNAEPYQVIAFAEQIQKAVEEKFGILLTREVRYVNSQELYTLNQLMP